MHDGGDWYYLNLHKNALSKNGIARIILQILVADNKIRED